VPDVLSSIVHKRKRESGTTTYFFFGAFEHSILNSTVQVNDRLCGARDGVHRSVRTARIRYVRLCRGGGRLWWIDPMPVRGRRRYPYFSAPVARVLDISYQTRRRWYHAKRYPTINRANK